MRFLRGKECASAMGFVGALAVWLGMLAAPAAQEAGGPRARVSQLERLWVRPFTPLELRRRLATVDVAELPALFALAAGVLTLGENGTFEIEAGEREIVRVALAERPRRELVPFLEDLASRGPLPAERLEAQRILALMGSGEHSRLLTRLTVSAQERGAVPSELRRGFERALAAMLARDPAALGQVPGLLTESPPGVASAIVAAVDSLPSSEATHALAGLLGRSPGLDPLLLARLGGRERPAEAERLFENLRRYLRHREPGLVRAAVRVCSRLEDRGALESLVLLVDHPEERVRAEVFGALEFLTGLDFGADPERWARWHESELEWWEQEGATWLLRVERSHGPEFLRAVREVLEHRLHRERIAEAIAQTLTRSDPDEVRLACHALEELRSHAAVPALIPCLDREEPELRMAAWKALRTITGAELAPEPDSWTRLFQ